MSIKGIDTQMMITRLTDNVRDTSVLQKRPEVEQDQLAAQGRVNDAQSQSKVIKTSESAMEKIRTDVDGEGGGAYGGGAGPGPGKDAQDDELELKTLAPPDQHIIDIKI